MSANSDETIGQPEPGPRESGQPTLAGGGVGREHPGDQVGPFKLISLIGEGGMGAVWLAERRQPYVQRVALKLIKGGMDSKSVLARFEQERQALAVMSHPGIAKVLDGGMTPSGRPYFAMDFVKGEPMTDFCDRVKLGIEERLRLFEQACEAVQHAHLKGIVHRDLKPSNILAFMVEGEGPKLKVIDFGVSKAMSHRMSEHTVFTETGQMIGTPEYMSPEQADPTAGDIDTRSDVYSLGVLLYELLSGATPFDARELRKKAYGEIQRMLREEDPPRPSARLSTMATKDQASASRIESARMLRVADLVKRLRGELEWIPLKAMRKEPQHRYQSAMALAEDVRNYLEGRPLVAAPESATYRIRKYIKRNRALVAGAGAVLAALVIGLGLATWQWLDASRARDAALASEQRALSEKAEADLARAAAVASEAKAIAQGERTKDLLTVAAMGTALNAASKADPAQVNRELATLSEIGRADRFPAHLALAMSDHSIGRPMRHGGPARCVVFSADGKKLASASSDNTIRLWDALTGNPIGELPFGLAGDVSRMAISPDGKTAASAGYDNAIHLWDTATGRELCDPMWGHRDIVYDLSFSRDGKLLATASQDRTIQLWDAITGKPVGEPLRGHEGVVFGLDFSPDGKVLASTSEDKTIRLWDAVACKQLGEPLRGHEDMTFGVAFSPDGKRIASGSVDKTIRLWDAMTGRPIGEPLRGHEKVVVDLAFNPDGTILASTSEDKTIRLWDALTGKPLGEQLRGHEALVSSVAFSPDSRTLASSSFDATIRLWDVPASKTSGEPLRAGEGPFLSLAFSPDGMTLASAGVDKTIRRWDALTGRPLGEALRGHEGVVRSVAFSPDGKTLVSASHDKTIRQWDARTGQQIGTPLRGHEDQIRCAAFSPDGKMLASASHDMTIRLWDAHSGSAIGEPMRGHEDQVLCAAFSPDGKTLASGSEDQTIRLWDVATGKQVGEPLRGHVGAVPAVAFRPDGKTLASGGVDKTIHIWNAVTGKRVGEPLHGHDYQVTSLTFSPDGQTLASGSLDDTIRLWETVTGKQVGDPLRGHETGVLSLAFSADGKTLASGSMGNDIRLWVALPLRERREAIVQRLAQADQVRETLSAQAAGVGLGEADTAAFQASVLADARFGGDLRLPALIVVGEVAQDREKARAQEREGRKAQLEPIRSAMRDRDWPRALRLVSEAPDEVLAEADFQLWNDLAWNSLVGLPADSPLRDLNRVLQYAQRAVDLSQRTVPAMLDTLARAHWEHGDKSKAIDVQREAVTVLARLVAANPNDVGKSMRAGMEATLKLYETLPAGSPLPRE